MIQERAKPAGVRHAAVHYNWRLTSVVARGFCGLPLLYAGRAIRF